MQAGQQLYHAASRGNLPHLDKLLSRTPPAPTTLSDWARPPARDPRATRSHLPAARQPTAPRPLRPAAGRPHGPAHRRGERPRRLRAPPPLEDAAPLRARLPSRAPPAPRCVFSRSSLANPPSHANHTRPFSPLSPAVWEDHRADTPAPSRGERPRRLCPGAAVRWGGRGRPGLDRADPPPLGQLERPPRLRRAPPRGRRRHGGGKRRQVDRAPFCREPRPPRDPLAAARGGCRPERPQQRAPGGSRRSPSIPQSCP